MNRTYSIVYNAALGQYQVASEKTKTRRSKVRKLLPIILASVWAPTWAVNVDNGVDAVNVSEHPAAQWEHYTFNTVAPVDPAKKFNFDDWKTALDAYVKDPNNSIKKFAWETASQALKENVANYFSANKGFLNINEDKTFTLTASTTTPTEKLISKDGLVAISVGADKNLTYELNNPLAKPDPRDEPGYTSRLFNIKKDGTLIITGEEGSSITIKGFKISNTDSVTDAIGGAIYNLGNLFLGDNVAFESNVTSSIQKSSSGQNFSAGGAIYNQSGILNLGDYVTFLRNTSFSSGAAGALGGAIYNIAGVLNLGNHAKFEGNGSSSSSFFSSGGAIYNENGVFNLENHAKFEGNTSSSSFSSSGGAIYNKNGVFNLGNHAKFKGNTSSSSSSSSGGAIYNQSGTLNLGDYGTFINNTSTHDSTISMSIHPFSSSNSFFASGGAIDNRGSLTLGENTTFRENTNQTIMINKEMTIRNPISFSMAINAYGGGIYNSGAITLGDNTNFTGNITHSDYDVNFKFIDALAIVRVDLNAHGGGVNNSGAITLGDNANLTGNIAHANFTVKGQSIDASATVEASVNAQGGGINNSGTITLGDNTNFTGNIARANITVKDQNINPSAKFSVNAKGGGIHNSGIITLGDNAIFRDNIATAVKVSNIDITVTASGGAIYNSGTFNLKTGTWNDVTLFTGNLANGQANSIHQNRNGQFNITDNGTLDMRDPFTGEGTFNKSGKSVWKLGGDNTTKNLNINEGTLYLYAQDEVGNANKNNADAKVGLGNLDITNRFILASDTALSLGGQGHTIKADSADIQKDANIRFNLHRATAGSTPIVTFNIKNLTQNFLDNAKIDIHTLAKDTGTYTLIKGQNLANLNQDSLYVRGESIKGTLLENDYQLSGTANDITLDVNKIINNQEVTWNGASNQWNMTAQSWDGRPEKQYLVGDKVVFTGKGKGVVINSGGVVVSEMEVSGGDYKFSGGAIETTDNVKNLSGTTQKLTIKGGSTVDFSGITGRNNFAGGVFLDKGTLSVNTLNQLGTNLSNMTFGSDATLNFTDSVIIDGKGGSDQRISVDKDEELKLSITDGKTLIFKNNDSSSGGAIYNSGTFNLKTGTQNDVIVFTGNLANGQANSIHQESNGTFNIIGDGTLDMRDPFTGEGTFNKSGKGVWKLGGDNETKNLNLNGGTLYLYAKDEVGNANKKNVDAKVGLGHLDITEKFTLVSGTALSLGGQGHTIKADSADIQDNANIRFNLHRAEANSTPLVTFNIKNPSQNFLDKAKIDIHTLAKDTGAYTLIKGQNLANFNQDSLYVRGESIKGTLLDGIYQLSGTVNDVKLNVQTVIDNQSVTWDGSVSRNWNMTDKNWNGRGQQQYLLGDKVVFNTDGKNKDISINSGGVVVSEMEVSGGVYKFSGGAIETTDNVRNLKDTTQKLTIKGGSTVDFTGITGRNNFAGGVVLDQGTLSVSTLNQLGTNLSNMTFGSDATLNFTDSITIDGKGSGDQRISIIDKKHALNIIDGKTLTFKNNDTSDSGGAIVNMGTFTLGDDVTFTGNTASSGGAIVNMGTFTLGDDVTFTGNTASSGGAISNRSTFTLEGDATFTGNTSSTYGGAIYNDGEFTLRGATTFTGNTAFSPVYLSSGGAIDNRGEFTLGGDATFTGNTSSTYGGAIYNSGTFNLKTGSQNDVIVFTGNLANGQANSIHQNRNGQFNITDNGTLDMRDPFMGEGTFNKSGKSVWKLGGDNTTENLNINEGTLYLYAQDEVGNANKKNADAKVGLGNLTLWVFTLASDAALSLGGKGHTIKADSADIQKDANIRFNLHRATAGSTPIVTFNIKNLTQNFLDNAKIDIHTLAKSKGAYTLIKGQNLANLNQDSLYVRGESIKGTLLENDYQLSGTANDITLDVNKIINNQEVTWNGASNQWNMTAKNWDGRPEKQYLVGDKVVFTGKGKDVVINAGGVTVSDMLVSGGDYKFSGGVIETMREIVGTSLTYPTQRLTIEGDATVDFSGITGRNNFAGGVFLDKGTLSVSTFDQLGTNLSNIRFGRDATLNFTDSVIIDGKSGSDQRIVIYSGQKIEIKIADGKTLAFNTSYYSMTSLGGAIYNDGIFSLGDNVKFAGNTISSSPSTAYGGAIYNGGVVSEAFSLGDNAKFEGNTASSNSSAFGGAIFNGGVFNGGFSVGAGTQFIKNEAQSTEQDAFGGAIFNGGTFNLATDTRKDVTLFTGNLANGKANSIHQQIKGAFNITGDGTLDMRDPFTGAGTFNKSGKSVWKLGGDNTTTNLNIYEGTLELYAKGDVDNGNRLDAQAEVMAGNVTATNMTLGTVNNGATLLANGGNTLSGTQLTLHSGSTFGFKVDQNTPVMTWDFKNPIKHQGVAKYTFEILNSSGVGRYHLLNSTNGHGFTANKLTLNDLENGKITGRLETIATLDVTLKDVYLNYSQKTLNAIASWNNAHQSAIWDGHANNWDIDVSNHKTLKERFLDKDQVVFGPNTQQQVIDITNPVKVGEMLVDGGEYKFTGKGITTDKTGVGLSNSTEQLRLINSANVDFTGITGTNHFANGIDIADGALTVSNKEQLGTDLSGVLLRTQGTLTLDIADKNTFNASGSLSGTGTVNKKGAGTWQLSGTQNVGVFNLDAGTLALGSHADITATTMTIGSTTQHSKVLMNGGNQLSGDALHVRSGGAQGSTTFGINIQPNNFVTSNHKSVAAINWNFKTIQNDGGRYTFDVSPVTSGVGHYHLLSSTDNHGFDKDKLILNYTGNTQTVGRLKTSVGLDVTLQDIYLNYSQKTLNAIATWNNANQSAIWDSQASHWDIEVEQKTSAYEKFLDKDQVRFGKNNHQQTIEIANNVVVGDMIVDGGDYKFTHGSITTDKTGVGLSSPAEQLTLINGAHVDFTDITGTNKFTNGIDINHGALTVSKKEQLGTDLSGVNMSTHGALNLDIAAHDSFDANGSLSGSGTVNKKGAGTWQLTGHNRVNALNLDAGTLALGSHADITATTLNAQAGTLELGQNSTLHAAQTMTLGTPTNGITLIAHGGNTLSGDTLTLQTGSTFKFHVSQDNFVDSANTNTAVMQWDFKTVQSKDGQYVFDISPLLSGVGQYHLLSSQALHGLSANQMQLTYSGFQPNTVKRLKDVFALQVGAQDVYVDYKTIVQNGVATWRNANNTAQWNVGDHNWEVVIAGQSVNETTFLTQDHVMFGQTKHQQTIDITHDVIVAGMDVTQGDYKFTGQGIRTSNAGVGIATPTEKLTLQNGATVDFTGITGTNHFAKGIDIAEGALTVSNAQQLGTDLSGVNVRTHGTLTLDIADKTMFDAKGSLSVSGTVNKKGAGTWQLNGHNRVNALTMQAGTLALNPNATITATTLTMGSTNQHSKLVMQSNNLLSGDVLALESGGVKGSTTFGITLGADHYVTSTHQAEAVMNWAFSTIVNDGGHYIWDVDTVPSGYGRYYLLNSTAAHNFNPNQLILEYAGYDPHSIDRIKDSFKFVVDSTNIYLDYSQISPNGIATWNNASPLGKWTVADKNWSVQITGQAGLGQTFLDRDHVVFGQNAHQHTIEITHDVIVSGMEVSGDYKFTGQGISTSNAGVGLTTATEQLSLQNGATVDFTGITGTNHFAKGIDIADGVLTVSNTQQLGTDLSGVNVRAQGTLMLDIADKRMFDAEGTLSGSGTVNKKGAGTWQLKGHHRMNAVNVQAGTLVLNPNATLTATTMTLGSADQHSKLLMNSHSKISGETLHLNAGGAKGSTTFNVALTADNRVTGANVAAMNWDFKAIHNDGGHYAFDITKLASGVGQYHVLNSATAHGLKTNQLKFTYAGFDPNSIERLKDVFKLTADATHVYLDYSQMLLNGTATWVNTNGSAVWNVADQNWSVAIPNYSALSKTFLGKDAVVFRDLGLTEQLIHVNAAGSEFELNGMIVNAGTDYTFNGDGLTLMAGTEILKRGSGQLALNNTVTGDVDVQGGSFIIGTSRQNKAATLAGNVIAQSGTTVGGHGTIEGIATLHEGATLSPGNSIGTLTVGELNLQTGSKVVLDAAPNGESDRIIAKKLATARGTTSGTIKIGHNVTLDIRAGAGQWSPSTKYSFMTAEGKITGAFSGVSTNLAFLTPTLVTGTTGAPELVMTRNDTQIADRTIARTYNQRATAGAISHLTQGHAVYDAVISMSEADARLAYDHLSGELYASTANALFQNANRLHEGMLSRIHENSTGLWLDGWGYTGEIKGDSNAAKVDNKGSGLLLGYDWAMKDNVLIGAALGYEESKIKLKEHNRKGENTVKSTHFMVYGNVDLEVIELKAGLNYSALRYKANRHITIPTLVGTANAKYRGHQVQAFVEASKTFNITEYYDVAPYVNVAYTEITAKDFTETGSQAALYGHSGNNSRTSVTLGMKNDWHLGVDKNLAITADVGWKHTFGSKTQDQRFNFVGSDQSFNIRSASINQNSAVVGLGIRGQHKDWTIDVGYQGEFNRQVKDHALSAKLKWSF